MKKIGKLFTGENNIITGDVILVNKNSLSFNQDIVAGNDILLPGIYTSNERDAKVEVTQIDEDSNAVYFYSLSKCDNQDTLNVLSVSVFTSLYSRQ